MSHIGHRRQESVVEVKTGPGESLQARTTPAWRQITGYRITDPCQAITRLSAPVQSRLPHLEYQSDLEEFRQVLNSAIRVKAREAVASTLLGDRRWWELVEISDAVIYIDVTDCNHVPMDVRGWQDAVAGGEVIRAYWQAWLISAERIDECDPKQPFRTVAGYSAALDPSGSHTQFH